MNAHSTNKVHVTKGKVFKQQKGGPIGLEITGILARLVMLWWDREFLEKAKKLDIQIMMYLRNVDDGNIATEATEPETRFINDKVSILPEAVMEDQNIPADERTASFIKSLSNSIAPLL